MIDWIKKWIRNWLGVPKEVKEKRFCNECAFVLENDFCAISRYRSVDYVTGKDEMGNGACSFRNGNGNCEKWERK